MTSFLKKWNVLFLVTLKHFVFSFFPENFVEFTIRSFLDLNIAEQLIRFVCYGIILFAVCLYQSHYEHASDSFILLIHGKYIFFYRYSGPVLLIRRTRDEMITTK